MQDTELKAARAEVARHRFGSPEWEAAMGTVRNICARIAAEAPPAEFTSVDSGEHRTIRIRARIHGRLTAALAAQRPNPRFAAVLAARGVKTSA